MQKTRNFTVPSFLHAIFFERMFAGKGKLFEKSFSFPRDPIFSKTLKMSFCYFGKITFTRTKHQSRNTIRCFLFRKVCCPDRRFISTNKEGNIIYIPIHILDSAGCVA